MIRVLFFLALLAFLFGCLSQENSGTVGVDDFPNSIYARLQGELDSAGEGNATVVPEDPLNVIQGSSTTPHPAPKQAALKPALFKQSAPMQALDASTPWDTAFHIDSAWFSYSVTAHQGDTVFTDIQYFANGAPKDSLARILDMTAGKKIVVFPNGDQSISVFKDGDGDDRVLTPLGKAKVEVWVANTASGITELAHLVLDGGPDGNTETEADNRIYEAQWIRMQGSDTLAYAIYSDPDSDGILIDNGKTTPVDLEYFERNPKDKPEVADRLMRLRLWLRFKQEPQEFRRIFAIERGRDGRINTLSITGESDSGAGPDSATPLARDWEPGGKARVIVTVDHTPESDSIVTSEIVSVIKPESILGQDRDSLYSYSVKTQKRGVEERKASFSLFAPEPVPPGQKPRNGKVTLDLEYTDSTSVHVDGKFNQGGLIADMVARDGKLFHAEWDDKGQLRKLSVTDP
jgi:hypothetical protein